MNDPEGLYEQDTFAPTARLTELREGAEPTTQEIVDLYRMYISGCRQEQLPGQLTDFGAWLVGDQRSVTGYYKYQPPADMS